MRKIEVIDSDAKAVVSIRDDIAYMIGNKVYSSYGRNEVVIRYSDGSFDVMPKSRLKLKRKDGDE